MTVLTANTPTNAQAMPTGHGEALLPPLARRTTVGRPNVRRIIAGGLLSALFVGCMWAYTLENRWPYLWHPDEPSKAVQILSNGTERNFYHPQLLLESTDWATHWLGTERDPQSVIVIGRRISATFAALAVVALALCGYRTAGLPGLIAVAPVVALCPFFFPHTRVMKEDASLIFGISVALLGARLTWDWGRKPVLAWVGVVVLALGCATATSGKYVGAISVVLAVLTLAFAPHGSVFRALLRPVVFVSFLLLFVAGINHRILENLDGFKAGLEYEINHTTTDHYGLTMDKPNTFMIDVTREQLFPHALALAGISVVLCALWWRAKTASNRLGWDRCVWVFTGAFLLLLSQSVLPMNRYALPLVMLVSVMSGIGAARVGQFVDRSWATWGVPVLFAVVTIAWQGPVCAAYLKAITPDGREGVRQFLFSPEMANASIAAERYVSVEVLPVEGRDDGLLANRQIRRVSYLSDYGSLETLRSEGFTHVVSASGNYSRYYIKQIRPTPEFESDFNQRREFYDRLFKEGKLVWTNEPPGGINPRVNVQVIRVYKIMK